MIIYYIYDDQLCKYIVPLTTTRTDTDFLFFINGSWCCTACAISEARSKMDGSGCSFNYMAMRSPVVIHWLMRSAYGIPSDNECVDDCMIPTCCTCCAVNQMYQTAMIRENPSTDGGSRFNLKAFSHESTQVWLLFTLIAVLSYLGIYTTIFL